MANLRKPIFINIALSSSVSSERANCFMNLVIRHLIPIFLIRLHRAYKN